MNLEVPFIRIQPKEEVERPETSKCSRQQNQLNKTLTNFRSRQVTDPSQLEMTAKPPLYATNMGVGASDRQSSRSGTRQGRNAGSNQMNLKDNTKQNEAPQMEVGMTLDKFFGSNFQVLNLGINSKEKSNKLQENANASDGNGDSISKSHHSNSSTRSGRFDEKVVQEPSNSTNFRSMHSMSFQEQRQHYLEEQKDYEGEQFEIHETDEENSESFRESKADLKGSVQEPPSERNVYQGLQQTTQSQRVNDCQADEKQAQIRIKIREKYKKVLHKPSFSTQMNGQIRRCIPIDSIKTKEIISMNKYFLGEDSYRNRDAVSPPQDNYKQNIEEDYFNKSLGGWKRQKSLTQDKNMMGHRREHSLINDQQANKDTNVSSGPRHYNIKSLRNVPSPPPPPRQSSKDSQATSYRKGKYGEFIDQQGNDRSTDTPQRQMGRSFYQGKTQQNHPQYVSVLSNADPNIFSQTSNTSFIAKMGVPLANPHNIIPSNNNTYYHDASKNRQTLNEFYCHQSKNSEYNIHNAQPHNFHHQQLLSENSMRKTAKENKFLNQKERLSDLVQNQDINLFSKYAARFNLKMDECKL